MFKFSVHTPGTIELGGGGVINCMVRNLSSTGAMLDVASPVGIPEPPADGISVYAGHDAEGVRHIHFALKDETSSVLNSLRSRLETENHFDVEPTVRALVEKFALRITRTVSAGARYFRARIGVEARYSDLTGGG